MSAAERIKLENLLEEAKFSFIATQSPAPLAERLRAFARAETALAEARVLVAFERRLAEHLAAS